MGAAVACASRRDVAGEAAPMQAPRLDFRIGIGGGRLPAHHSLFREIDTAMIQRLFVATLIALMVPFPALAESHSAVRIDIAAGPAPRPVPVDGRMRLLYELRLTNYRAAPLELTSLEVLADDRALARVSGDGLEPMLAAVGPADAERRLRTVAGGRGVILFMDLALNAGEAPPTRLRHRFHIAVAEKDGSISDNLVSGPDVDVPNAPALVLRPPLSGSNWVAANGLTNPAHRRSVVPVDGKARIAQRFAIDWIKLGPDGSPFHGSPGANANYYGYGAQVLAVADGRVADVKDGLPENAGDTPARPPPLALETIAGNHLILDLGHGNFAVYAHLQPGSLRVKPGDRVRAGQVLALLGNSGNSDAPHLHFHLVDGPSNLGAEGRPYVLKAFSQQGAVADLEGLFASQAWKPVATITHRNEFPADNAVVSFADKP